MASGSKRPSSSRDAAGQVDVPSVADQDRLPEVIERVPPTIDADVSLRRRDTRKHQVKVSLCREDAAEISSFALREGAGVGTLVRRLALKHVAALCKLRVATPPVCIREGDRVNLGHHVSVWFTDEEYTLLQRFATGAEVTVSGYIGRCVLESWLLRRRVALGLASTTAHPSRRS